MAYRRLFLVVILVLAAVDHLHPMLIHESLNQLGRHTGGGCYQPRIVHLHTRANITQDPR